MKFLMLLGVFFSLATAQAEIVFAPGISYSTIKSQTNGATTTDGKTVSYDLKVGYVHPSGLYLGGMYAITKFDDNGGYAAGPTLGYSHYSGFYALFTYFLTAQQNTASNSKLTSGMGPQIDLGWVFPITSVFFIGPQISYRSIGYDKLESSGVSASTDQSLSQIMPFVSLWFRF